jgi:hypothetical protein
LPGVVVVDLDTPGADWHDEFLARLRDEGDIGNPRVIVISGSDPRVIPQAAAVSAVNGLLSHTPSTRLLSATA